MQNYIKAGIEVGGFKPVEIGYAKKEDETVKTYGISNSVADILVDKDKTEGLTGNEIVNKYASKFKYLPQSYINDFKKNNPDYIRTMQQIGEGAWAEKYDINERAATNARKLSMVALWGEEASKQADVVQAMKDLQEAMKNGDAKKVQDILKAYTPTSHSYMSDLNDAEAIKNIQDPTKYREWQEIQYNILNNLVKEQQTPFLYYKNAMDLIKSYEELAPKERKGYDISQLGQTLIQSVPIAFNGTTASISLNKMGRIDWAKLAESVNNNIPFTVTQQQDILQSVYDAIYNDPNIEKCKSIVELLQTYLPEIANMKSPYDEGGRFQTWEEANASEETPQKTNHTSILARPTSPLDDLPKFSDLHTPKVPMWQTDLDRMPGKTLGEKMYNYRQKYPDRFPQENSSTNNPINTNKNHTSRYDPSDDKKKQKDYASTYGRNAAKPTQVIINIDNLARFDRTAIAGDSDERAIAAAIETKIAEAVSMLSSQILTTASSAISQGI